MSDIPKEVAEAKAAYLASVEALAAREREAHTAYTRDKEKGIKAAMAAEQAYRMVKRGFEEEAEAASKTLRDALARQRADELIAEAARRREAVASAVLAEANASARPVGEMLRSVRVVNTILGYDLERMDILERDLAAAAK
jgi:hypothetical protein